MKLAAVYIDYKVAICGVRVGLQLQVTLDILKFKCRMHQNTSIQKENSFLWEEGSTVQFFHEIEFFPSPSWETLPISALSYLIRLFFLIKNHVQNWRQSRRQLCLQFCTWFLISWPKEERLPSAEFATVTSLTKAASCSCFAYTLLCFDDDKTLCIV